jgi:putative endonuclease
MASRRHGTFDVGVTGNPTRRAWQHREGLVPGFTQRYGVKLLVWYEFHDTMIAAITREKQIKEWRRAWKIELIESMNPEWRDLYPDLGF